MPKRSRENVENDVLKIVKIFQTDARISFNELAKKSGFSRQKIWRIIRNLEKNNTIWGYTTVFDMKKFGLKQFIIMLKRKAGTQIEKQLEQLIDRKIKDKIEELGVFIESSFYTNGEYDWISIAHARNIIDMKKYMDFIMRFSGDILEDVKIVEILFPLEKNNIENPNKRELYDYFK